MTQVTKEKQDQVVNLLKDGGQCGIRTDSADNDHTFKFQIQRGEQAKMFTLRLLRPTHLGYEQDMYLGRLANTYDKALRRAVEIVLNHPSNVPGNWVFIDVKVDSLKPIKQRQEFNSFPFGKYQGLKFSEVTDNGYKEWLYPVLCEKGSGYIKLARALREDMIENGFEDRNGNLVSPETIQREQDKEAAKQSKMDFWNDLKANSRYLGVEIGTKIDFFRAYLLNETSFQTSFGIMHVQVFMDDEKRVFVYKGSEKKIQAQQGEPFYVRGKVKDYTKYNETCQTQLSNLVVLDKGGMGLCGDKAAGWAKHDGYNSMAEALDNPSFVEEVLKFAHDVGNLPKKDWKFARSVIKEVLQNQSL